MKITGTCKGAELDKRFYMSGVIITDICPKCGENWEHDLGHNYIQQYMTVGKPIEVTGYCNSCENEWKVGTVVINVALEQI